MYFVLDFTSLDTIKSSSLTEQTDRMFGLNVNLNVGLNVKFFSDMDLNIS